MKTKVCTKCGEEKVLEDFHIHKLGKDRRHPQCKECLKSPIVKERDRLFIEGKRQCPCCKEIKTLNNFSVCKSKKYGYSSHCKDCQKLFRIKNAKKIKKQQKNYYLNNIEYVSQRQKKYNDKNRTKISNKESHRRKTILHVNIQHTLACRIRNAVKGNNKSLSTMFLIGCEIDYLLYHLQEQFKPGMSWDNHGLGANGKKEWHIDHIRPCASFDLSDPKQQLICFNYKNLQPLWALENLQKKDKITNA